MSEYTAKQLAEILDKHAKWLRGEDGGVRANLGRADLSCADLRDANLGGAYLDGANLRDAYLSGADLRGANLSGADLCDADLSAANVSGGELPPQRACMAGASARRNGFVSSSRSSVKGTVGSPAARLRSISAA